MKTLEVKKHFKSFNFFFFSLLILLKKLALCLIGGSRKQSSEFIEEKGIGFKSVFRITNTPFIFSNDFQFKFDATKRLGYILPEWENLTNLHNIPEAIFLNHTHFYLPIWSDLGFQAKNLSEEIDQVLLFLKKLKQIKLTTVNKASQELTKEIQITEKFVNRTSSLKIYKYIGDTITDIN